MLVPPWCPLAVSVAVTVTCWGGTCDCRHWACAAVMTFRLAPVAPPGDSRTVMGWLSKVDGQRSLSQLTPGADSSTVKWVRVMLFISSAFDAPAEARLFTTSSGSQYGWNSGGLLNSESGSPTSMMPWVRYSVVAVPGTLQSALLITCT